MTNFETSRKQQFPQDIPHKIYKYEFFYTCSSLCLFKFLKISKSETSVKNYSNKSKFSFENEISKKAYTL